MNNIITLLLFIIVFTSSCKSSVSVVNDLSSFNNAVKNAGPGDKIVLANGIWHDVELVFEGKGTKEQPIILSVESKGKIFLEGQSNIRIAGEYLVVEGLVFRNGYTPTSEVISFRKDNNKLCHHCRVTQCVIDDYNQKERFESDYWVALYGKNNRFDHNYLIGKRNLGVSLAVRLNTPESQENHHQIDHNYFGYHPILGSNGGETMRIGTSHYSLKNSNTIVENNYFEHCNGEHEIISNKSCQNTFRNNTFYECQGTLTMRHGNETLVENNYFFGNRKPNTGGIRIINESQIVRNNYCEGLTGYRFRGALVIMNGVPDSPINRYFQVRDSEASNNLFVDCDYIQLCAGSDSERSATPINTKISDNIFTNEFNDNIFTIYDDVSGITCTGNLLGDNIQIPTDSGGQALSGFNHQVLEIKHKDGLKYIISNPNCGPDKNAVRPTPENTGVTWYPKKDYQIRFNTGKEIVVSPGENTLFDAVKMAENGDILILSAGEYLQSKSIDIDKVLSIKAGDIQQKPLLTFERASLFNIENGGSLFLQGLEVSGARCDDYAGNSVIRTSRYSMINNYKLMMADCNFKDLDVNHSFSVFRVYKNTFADSVSVVNCHFSNITGHVLELDKESDDIGIYNAENVVIKGCQFDKIGGTAVTLHRGGGDESTFGPILEISNSTFDRVGNDKKNKYKASIAIHGVQWADMHDLKFNDSKQVNMFLTVGDPVIKVRNSEFVNTEAIKSNADTWEQEALMYKQSEKKE